MQFDKKQAKLLSQTLFCTSSAFGFFSFGLFMSIIFMNNILALCVLIFGTLSLLGIVCLPFAAEKLACIWTFAGCIGYYAGVYCQMYGLVTSDIIFALLATVFVGVSASIAAYISRELVAFYALMAGIASMFYVPMSIYYIFFGGNMMYLVLVSIAFVVSVVVFMIDTRKVMMEIQRGQPDVWILSIMMFEDLFDLFMQIAKLLIALKRSNEKKKNE